MFELNDKVKIKWNIIIGTIIDKSSINGKTNYVIESDTKETAGGYGGKWKLYDCNENEIEKMTDIFAYEGKNVEIMCNNGKIYSGEVKWCARAEDIDEDDDVLAINDVGLLASDIKTIKEI